MDRYRVPCVEEIHTQLHQYVILFQINQIPQMYWDNLGITNNSGMPIAASQTMGTNNSDSDVISHIPVTQSSLETTPILINRSYC